MVFLGGFRRVFWRSSRAKSGSRLPKSRAQAIASPKIRLKKAEKLPKIYQKSPRPAPQKMKKQAFLREEGWHAFSLTCLRAGAPSRREPLAQRLFAPDVYPIFAYQKKSRASI